MASSPPMACRPSILGAPKFAVIAFRVSIDLATLASACACQCPASARMLRPGMQRPGGKKENSSGSCDFLQCETYGVWVDALVCSNFAARARYLRYAPGPYV